MREHTYWWLPLLVILVACGSPPRFDTTPTDATLDTPDTPQGYEAAVDTALLGRVCQRDEQCNDGVDCTDDRCVENRCVNSPVHQRCDDRVYCNGSELCDRYRGCVQGEPVNCNDNQVCTADRCNEETHQCEHRPLDRDGDGDPDDHCHAIECGDAGVPEPDAGVTTPCWRGHDCDDQNPRVNSLLPEICGDGMDNNCNGHVDMAEPGGCRNPPYDRCNDPLDISSGGAFTLEMTPLARDYTLRCAGSLAHDGVARFRLTEPRDLFIEGTSRTSIVGLALQTACGSTTASDTLECHLGLPAVLRRHSLPPGEYFVLVASSGTGSVDLTVTFSPPTPAPTNDTCASATVLPGPGTYPASTVGLRDDYPLSCNPGSHADAVFEFTTRAVQDVSIRSNAMGSSAAIAVVSECTPLSILRCNRGFFGTPPAIRVRSLPAGRWYILAETGSPPAPFQLSLSIDPPTPPITEDACPRTGSAPAVDLGDGMPHLTRIAELEDDYTLSCNSFRPTRDGVYLLTVPTTSDVRITAEAAAGQTYVSLRNAPCLGGSERRCVGSGAMSSSVELTQRALPSGTYWVFVENTANDNVTVRAEILPPSPAVNYSLSMDPPGVSFIDVCSMTGSRRVLPNVDDSVAMIGTAGDVPVPFPVRVYGLDARPPFTVSSNGWMAFTSTTDALSGTIPSPSPPNWLVAGYWRDLITRSNGVCYGVVGTAPNRKYVVQWDDVMHFSGRSGNLTFEVIINEAPMGTNNTIDVIYQRMDGAMTATAGIENDDGSDGVVIPGPFTAPRVVRLTPSR